MEVLSYIEGQYSDPVTNEAKVVTAGAGYSMRVVALLNDKIVAFDTTNTTFSYTGTSVESGTPAITVTVPNGGEKFWVKTKGEYGAVVFKQSGFDPFKNGQYQFHVELWKGNMMLGYLSGLTPYQLNTGKVIDSLGYTVGEYADPKDFSSHKATAGTDYKVKVVVTIGKDVIVSDESDAPFSYITNPSTIQKFGFEISLAGKSIGNFFKKLFHKNSTNDKSVDNAGESNLGTSGDETKYDKETGNMTDASKLKDALKNPDTGKAINNGGVK